MAGEGTQILHDSQWISGLDSISYTLGQGSYQWAQNVVNRGGILQTRQGFAEVASVQEEDPRGLSAVTISGVTWLLAAIGENIYKMNVNSGGGLIRLNYPGTANPVVFPNPGGVRRMVHFELCVQAQKSVPDGTGYDTVQLPNPKFVVIIQDGATDPHYWDGVTCQKVDDHPDFIATRGHNTPKAQFMKWAGDRLWTINGRKVRSSNLLNPFQNTEEINTSDGGFFFLPDNCTGVGVTHDFQSLLAFTHFTTSAFQVGIEDRSVWSGTQDFQRVLFPSIGCASHRTIINMYGMTWWMSHDGWLGLDNTLSAFQSSRLDIRDLNMSRSKEGINWSTGGGCAGSFGNFLFVSVPSYNKWNQHTWVMDQSPINTIIGQSPPAWCSNWTGIRPEQWVTCQVNSKQRCFCISRDLTNTGHQSTVWEAFIGQRMDVPKVGADPRAKDIGCAVETRFMGLSDSQYSATRWIELDIAEIIGKVVVEVYYSGRRTSYKRILQTNLNAVVTGNDNIINGGDPLSVFVPQFRTVRSTTDLHEDTDADTEIQTPYLRNLDREFSVLVLWSGQMALTGIRMVVDPRPDYLEGVDYERETDARRITAGGTGTIGGTVPDNSPTNEVHSKFMAPLRPKWVELPSYDAAVPNGVYFVAELSASPAPGAYPSNIYPITVNLSTETVGADIYFDQDGTIPHGPPNPHGTLYGPTSRPAMTLGQTLKAVGVRQQMIPSVLLSGRYTQAQVASVVFDPPAGDFAPDAFADPNAPNLGPLVSYNFDEGTGTVVHDLSGGVADGTVHHTTWNPQGKHGKALNFNGTTSYVGFGTPAVFDIMEGSGTWSAWVKAAADPTGDGTVISKATVSTGWTLGTTSVSGSQRFCISIAGGAAKRYSTTVRALNTWYYVTGVFNADAHTLDIYVNGVLDNGTLTGSVPSSQTNSSGSFLAGRFNGANYWNGVIDDIRIYPRVLSVTDIAADMNTGVTQYVIPSTGFAVTMSTDTAGADIRYLIGTGTVTEENGTLYDPAHPPHPFPNTTFQAKAFKQYYLPSDQVSAFYHALPRCATPTCAPDGGSYPGSDYPKNITIHTNTAGAKLRYTVNDTDVAHGTIVQSVTGHVIVHDTDVLRVIAQKDGHSDSDVKMATYNTQMTQVETPVISPDEVVLTGNVHNTSVQVSCATQNVDMRYVIVPAGDNTQPSRTFGTHTSDNPATILIGPPDNNIGHRVLRVMAYRVDMDDSEVAEGTYDHEGGG